jgi:hypothetical protein
MKDLQLAIRELDMLISEAITEIADGQDFSFVLDDEDCKFSHEHGKEVFEVPDRVNNDFSTLLAEIHGFEKRISSLRLKPLEVSEFLRKYFQMSTKITKAMRRMRVSVRLGGRRGECLSLEDREILGEPRIVTIINDVVTNVRYISENANSPSGS